MTVCLKGNVRFKGYLLTFFLSFLRRAMKPVTEKTCPSAQPPHGHMAATLGHYNNRAKFHVVDFYSLFVGKRIRVKSCIGGNIYKLIMQTFCLTLLGLFQCNQYQKKKTCLSHQVPLWWQPYQSLIMLSLNGVDIGHMRSVLPPLVWMITVWSRALDSSCKI
jgi:hypothetical protein